MQDVIDTDSSDDVVEEILVDLPKEDIDDIEKAVEASMSESNASKEQEEDTGDDSELDGEAPGKDKEEPEPEDDNEVSDGDSEDDSDDDEVSDEMLEKAIALGVPIAEARKLGSDLLQTRIAGLEKEASSQDSDSADDESPSKDPLEGIPDLDPEVYDEELVEGFKAMKQIIRDQSAALAKIAQAGSDDKVLSKLEGDAAKALEASPAKEAELMEKVNMLTAGYKAIGKEVSSADVLAEAAGSVLGEEIAKVAAGEKSVKAKKRSGQKINRPTGGRDVESKDVFDEIGDELDRKYFNKK